MSRPRTVDGFMRAPTHSHPEGRTCDVTTECAIHTVTLPEGSFSAIVLSRPERGLDVIAILDHDEVEEHIRLLRNAVEDAKLIDLGLEPVDRYNPEPPAMDERNDPIAHRLGQLLDKIGGSRGATVFNRASALQAMKAAHDSGRFHLSVATGAAATQLRDHQRLANEDGSLVTVSREALDVVINHLAIDGETKA